MRVVVCGSLLDLLAACASTSSEISATYVSLVIYSNYACQQLAMED